MSPETATEGLPEVEFPKVPNVPTASNQETPCQDATGVTEPMLGARASVDLPLDNQADTEKGADPDLTGGQGEEEEEWVSEVKVDYGVTETPPGYMCVLLGFQHYISMFIASLTIPILIAPAVCMDKDNVGKSEITGTLFVASGIITLLQSFIGCRLPIVQAGTFAILVPTLSFLALPQWECPNNILYPHEVPANVSANFSYIEAGSAEHREIWQIRFREIQGAIMCAALFEVFLGASGLVGVLLRYIGPLSICPTVALLGFSLFRAAAGFAATQWWISVLTISLMVIFSQYLGFLQLPCLAYTKSKGFYSHKYQIFKMFPVILAIALSWLICYILTVTDVFPADPESWGHQARTDLRQDALGSSPWFRIPYPLQWGMPTVSISAVCAILAGVLATTVESVGDYFACAKLSGAPPPPLHAVNRGILIEGLGSILDGLFGTGNGTTSTSINVGVVGLTKCGSRRVVQVSAVFMVVFGIFTKFGALFVTIPDPIIGGAFFILFGMITAVGISNLQHVDMNSGRNLFIIGFSLFNGLTLSQWVSANKGAIQTGNETADSVLQVLLSTSMFVGGVTGFFLDNTIPGTLEERGMRQWQHVQEVAGLGRGPPNGLRARLRETYDLPLITPWLRRRRWASYIPFSPTFGVRTRDNDQPMAGLGGGCPEDGLGVGEGMGMGEVEGEGVKTVLTTTADAKL